MDIRGVIPVSLNEWDGHVSAVIFTMGCNWRCPYCHGWRFVTSNELPSVGLDEVHGVLEAKEGWIDALTVSGGEPTLQESLGDFLADIKDRFGLGVKLETNGTNPDVLKELIDEKLVDCVALDYKAPFDRLDRVTRVDSDIDRVKESFELSMGLDIDVEYHTTLWPMEINVQTIRRMAPHLRGNGRWFLQNYRSGDCMDLHESGTTEYKKSEVDAIGDAARENHPEVVVL